MDWFRSGLAEAQKRAQEASEHAQKLAAQYSAQAKEQGTWLAEQATVQAKQLREKAAQEAQAMQARFAEYQAAQKAAGAAAGAEELARYAITDELCEFVSGLTYSTFSDMDMDALARSNKARAAPSDNNEDGTRLNPWQERHAMLVLSKVEQLQHLRFALCPK
ncbi:hypothetical protein DUNSADRAFT_13638 [Dunaliella salina]|uniref:Uncharacterized protein n=1 Tax=Dunaliella salina TaxID=3046 RepID=A0ABQ7G8Z5_DUNSA|nr:hypothetical protein DUNSADRAFT_13638 [Dunaliella salina]|eukprot:KAF5831082.1 hypothetical protein DUNSADRAFT_13638 [Dunaliella salina]